MGQAIDNGAEAKHSPTGSRQPGDRRQRFANQIDALIGATRALARELGVHGITVNCVSPGAFPTAAEAIHPDPDACNALVIGHQSVKHRGEVADIANALRFLASERSGFISGQTRAVDGGWYMA